MDWQLAITRNREALLIIVAALMRSVGLAADRPLTNLPHFFYRKALRRVPLVGEMQILNQDIAGQRGREAVQYCPPLRESKRDATQRHALSFT